MKSFIVVATYNERDNVGSLIDRLRAECPAADIVIVDDQSPDGTGDVVRQKAAADKQVHLLSRKGKRGYGHAMIAGFKAAIEHGAEVIATLDADFSHDPASMPELLKAIEGGADMAIGSRFKDGVRVLNWEASRLLLSIGANNYVRMLLRLAYADCTSGFRAYRVPRLAPLLDYEMKSRGYAFLVEILFWIHRSRAKIVEVPIVYSERRLGQSKMSKRVIVEAIFNPMRLWVRAITSPPRISKK